MPMIIRIAADIWLLCWYFIVRGTPLWF